MDKYIVTINRPWENDIRFFNSHQEAKEFYDDNLGGRPTLAKVIEYNHNLFPELKSPKWMQEALIIRHGKCAVEGVRDIWERIFHSEYHTSNVIEKYQDELGWAELHPKGRVLIYNKQSGFSIGITKL